MQMNYIRQDCPTSLRYGKSVKLFTSAVWYYWITNKGSLISHSKLWTGVHLIPSPLSMSWGIKAFRCYESFDGFTYRARIKYFLNRGTQRHPDLITAYQYNIKVKGLKDVGKPSMVALWSWHSSKVFSSLASEVLNWCLETKEFQQTSSCEIFSASVSVSVKWR